MHKLPHGHSPFTLLSHFKSQPPVKASIFLPFLYWDIIHRCSTGAASYFQQRKRASCKRSLSGSSSSIHPVHACRRGMAASSLVRGWMVGLRFPPVPARALTLSHTYCLNSDDDEPSQVSHSARGGLDHSTKRFPCSLCRVLHWALPFCDG